MFENLLGPDNLDFVERDGAIGREVRILIRLIEFLFFFKIFPSFQSASA